MTTARDLSNQLVELLRRERPAAPRATALRASTQQAAVHASGIATANSLPLLRTSEVDAAPDMVQAAPPAPAVAPCKTTEPRPSVEPLDADRARLHITVSRRLLSKLEAAKAALSHSHPGASSEEVLEAALDLLLAHRARRKGIVEKPRSSTGRVSSGAIPAAVKREVWTRAGGRCEWPLDSGGTCGSTLRLELDHVRPRALGGPSTVDNLRVACRFHNQLSARQAFGEGWMDRFARSARASTQAQGGRMLDRPARSRGGTADDPGPPRD